MELWTVDAGSGAATRVVEGVKRDLPEQPVPVARRQRPPRGAGGGRRPWRVSRGPRSAGDAGDPGEHRPGRPGAHLPGPAHEPPRQTPCSPTTGRPARSSRTFRAALPRSPGRASSPASRRRRTGTSSSSARSTSRSRGSFPWSRFPRRIEVRDRSGAVVHEVADLPLHEEIPIGRDSAPTGPRSVNWRGDHDATLVWTEARDGGDPHAEASVRDELMQLAAPFAGDPEVLLQVPLRMLGATFGGGRGGSDHSLVDQPRRADLVHPDGRQRRADARVRHVLRGSLRGAGNAADHPERARRAGAADLG